MKTNYPLKCENCDKIYNRESSYNKHKLLCCGNSNTALSIINPIRKNLTLAEVGECKSPPTLIQTVEELIKSNNKLREEVENLKKWAQIQKKKIIIIDWLNKNYKPNEDYKEYMNKLVITRNDLEIIFQSNLVIGIQEILQNYINKIDDKECSIKCFDQKENKIFGYNEKGEWEIIIATNFDKIILTITKKIIDEFKKWQDENESKIYTEEFSVIYLENIKKVMGGNMSMEKTHKLIHKNLYKFLKKNLQNIIEYEFS